MNIFSWSFTNDIYLFYIYKYIKNLYIGGNIYPSYIYFIDEYMLFIKICKNIEYVYPHIIIYMYKYIYIYTYKYIYIPIHINT